MKASGIWMKAGWTLVIAMAILACAKEDRYQQMVARELAKGVRVDSLFFGIYLGMPSKDFFDHCLQLNHRQLITQGPGGLSVQHIMKNELKQQAVMRFFPGFYDNKIYQMPVIYEYSAWAPWNRNLWADSLLVDLLAYYQTKYEGDFLPFPDSTGKLTYYKVDGNRQIALSKLNDREVEVVFTDLLVDPTVKPEEDEE
ncbi:MAG: hypothetical protein KDC30_21355 [Saprospiraceae bacterium]|nr:hypothetical protein [Saprospiraceae bacterium]